MKPEVESIPTKIPNLDILFGIEAGLQGQIVEDRGGFYSPELNIWVDRNLKDVIEVLRQEERRYVEAIAGVGLGIGRLHLRQLQDVKLKRMWPDEVFREDGINYLLSAAQENPPVEDPYSLLLNGLEFPGTPYSQAPHYRIELQVISQNLTRTLDSQSRSAQFQSRYLKALLKTYAVDQERISDLGYMHRADTEWIRISPESPFLILAEPTEVYQDPLRVVIGEDQRVVEWVKSVRERTGLLPWRNFFEFRLLQKAGEMMRNDEVEIIRKTSRRLYGLESDTIVSVSLEFRRLLWASGQGAHPAKTAKNYPNFDDIRENVGYKNVIYTNMVVNAAETELLPALRRAFPTKWVEISGLKDRLIRGKLLSIVAHEENHPFRKMSNTPLEELKSTVNGIYVLVESGAFTKYDIRDALLAEIGSALDTRHKMEKARENGDDAKQRALEAYYKADTILMNYLYMREAFVIEDDGRALDINFRRLQESIASLVEYLESIRLGKVSTSQIYELYGDEKVWDYFVIQD